MAMLQNMVDHCARALGRHLLTQCEDTRINILLWHSRTVPHVIVTVERGTPHCRPCARTLDSRAPGRNRREMQRRGKQSRRLRRDRGGLRHRRPLGRRQRPAGRRPGRVAGASAEGGAWRQHPVHRVLLANAEPRRGLRRFFGPLRRERRRPPRPGGDRGERETLRRMAAAPARPWIRRSRAGHDARRQCRADAALAHRLRDLIRLSAQLLHHREHDAHGTGGRRPCPGGGARRPRRDRP